MKGLSLLIGAATLVALAGVMLLGDSSVDPTASTDHFDAFNSRFGKKYASLADRAHRFKIFQANFEMIAAHNQKATATYTLEVNEFADLTFEEFAAFHLTELSKDPMGPTTCKPSAPSHADPPRAVDWRTDKKVQQVKNQKACGSCWAFAAVGAVESAVAITKSTEVPDLSEQELVDCSRSYGNQGCAGGYPWLGFDYILENKINDSKAYPYYAVDLPCQVPKVGKGKVEITGCIQVNPTLQALTEAIAVTPVAIGFSVQDDFRFYKAGLYNPDSCPLSPNHGMLAVGYNIGGGEYGVPYFIVKNSWSFRWGEQGFVKVAFGSGPGTCGIAGNGCNTYPTVSPNKQTAREI